MLNTDFWRCRVIMSKVFVHLPNRGRRYSISHNYSMFSLMKMKYSSTRSLISTTKQFNIYEQDKFHAQLS